MLGVDYASIDANPPPDVKKAKAAGVTFVYQRASFVYRHTALTDPHCNRDRPAWNAAGVPWGAYIILSYDPAGPSPEDQMKVGIGVIGDRRPGELPVMLDVETDSQVHDEATVAQRREWVERAYDALVACYGFIGVYTSQNQWEGNFGGGESRIGNGPGWIKVPYPYREDPPQPPHPEAVPVLTDALIPAPWKQPGTPGAWFEQIQGNARGLAGFAGTVDLNVWRFVPYQGSPEDKWLMAQLAKRGYQSTRAFQAAENLASVDGVVGPATFAVLTA